ncbi:MAG: DUF4129 domain-containing protein [Firmicutes bacterium]|nr:DUF4129 domain-containing protein [Bacillota bacterium]
MTETNKRKFFLHLRKIAVLLFQMYIVVILASYIMTAITKDPADIWRMQLLVIPILYLYLIRCKVRNFFLFFLLHLLALLPAAVYIPLLGNPTVETIYIGGLKVEYYMTWDALGKFGIGIMVLAEVFFIIISAVDHFKGLSDTVGMGGLIVLTLVLTAGYLGADIMQNAFIRPYLLGCELAAILVYFEDMHTRNVNNTLTNINEMLNQPEQKIRRSNNRILLMFLVGTAVFALIAVALRLDRVIVWLLQALLAGIRFLVGLIPKKDAPPDETSIPIDSAPEPSGDHEMMPPDGGSTAAIWIYLEYLMTFALIVAIMGLVIYGLYRFYKWFYSRSLKTVHADEFEETTDYIETKPTERVRRPGSFLERLRLTDEKKVRRMYKKRLAGPMKKGDKVRPSDTPEEILRKLPAEKLDALSEVYERARYSREGITREDVKKAGG